jgi:neutral ceramidase
MNYYNVLVSGDHKGYASLAYERELGATYGDSGEFVAAFAQSDPGDVTPNTNLDNTGPGDTDVETTRIMGQRQVEKARELFSSATELLDGPIDSRQIYVSLKNFAVEDRFTGQGIQRTCPSAYGYSFAGGSTEDGGGHFLFREGMKEQSVWRDWLIRLVTGTPAWTEDVRLCQAPKPILFETGSQNPPLQSQVHTVTLARIGQLVILGMPGEVTTMAGRRLRETVKSELGDWAKYIVLAGYVNEFAGYITTPQEYDLQQYEAAHNLHGRWSLPAYQQIASQLARDLENGDTRESQLAFDDLRGQAKGSTLPMLPESSLDASAQAGQPVTAPRQKYAPGETVQVEFSSAHPNTHLAGVENFLAVQHQAGQSWETLATDTDWSTRIRWRFDGDQALATLEWDIPADIRAGTYRLQHWGVGASGIPFQGVSAQFLVVD